ncbi:MAG: Mg chelatase-related protein [Parcubacteria group bacterium GW2011_GWA1_40_21]|nr:MAG: Mg chelatase-related protein [Parcubacteria group bacterium GW2011_GWA1_40_21]
MSFAKVYSAQVSLLKAQIVHIEVDLSKGLYAFSVVGLPDKAVEESRDRVSAAIKNSGFKSPKQKNQKIVIALAPADLKKEGPVFDLGMALAYLLASEEIKFNPSGKIFLGELSLDGEVRKISGVLAIAEEAKKRGFEEIYLPKENAREAALIGGIKIFGVKNIQEVIAHLNEKQADNEEDEQTEIKIKLKPEHPTRIETKEEECEIDFSEIKGQEMAKRGLEIAAAGGHNIAMYGPPGTGKTMLAKAFSHILPPLSFDEVLEITAIHSIARTLQGDLVSNPPMRSPHHTASYVSMVGGGAVPKPGEVTLAHRGVLFLDEFAEFDRRVIETLRQPLEEREINISRAKGSFSFPANFILIAAMNPCPCGNYGTKGKECVCAPINLVKYQRKISGPIIDRIDMWLEVSKVDHQKLSDNKSDGDTTKQIKKRVVGAREIQKNRFSDSKRGIKTNSEMNTRDLGKIINLKKEVKEILNASAEKLDLSARAYHRIIKLSRTIADLAGAEEIETNHILEALQYRPKKMAV